MWVRGCPQDYDRWADESGKETNVNECMNQNRDITE